MEPLALVEALIALAAESGVAVRRVRAPGDATPGPTSGPAVVRGQPLVALVAGEPPSVHAAALACALTRFAGPALAARYLPPALRACLDAAESKDSR